ncbi:MAG: sensor histidine kinase [Spirochaetales bacterium]|nr:sensor histidine kinase [Spirochaetales bacterium]
MRWYHDVTLEPGLLKIFRIFTLGVSLFFFLFFLFPPQFLLNEAAVKVHLLDTYPHIFAAMAFGYLLIFLYLSIPVLQHLLKLYYLPLAILGAIFFPMGIINWAPQLQESFSLSINPLNSWSVTILLLFPLIITAWQYSFHMVLILFAVLGILDPLISILAFNQQGQDLYQTIYASAVRIISFTAIGFVITELMKNQRQRQKDLYQANRKLEEYAEQVQELSVSRERNRLASELHDVLAHTLSGLTVHLEAIDSIVPEDQQRLHKELEKALKNTRKGLQETRRALQDLRAEPLEEFGFDYAMRHLADAYAKRSDISINLEYKTPLQDLPEKLEQNIYRIVQEALENVHRHARAASVSILFRFSDNSLYLDISDDGAGFSPELAARFCISSDQPGTQDQNKVENTAAAHVQNQTQDQFVKDAAQNHFGLYGMMVRIKEWGGSLEIKTAEGRGTSLHVRIPLSRSVLA